ncbi:MAG TPA: MEKHLA domain-containing protein [Leptolyngbyaceae cyanobacterium M65_K2018_010]|nr:MEKHLA domain-containing protein [Leptolyngbyaceae cyanobacterium M65_K2018_010]
MAAWPEPGPDNDYLASHIHRLRQSFRTLLGEDLIDPTLDPVAAARTIYQAPYVVVSHGPEADPLFNYGNRVAQALFEMPWSELTVLPSRLSAEPPNQAERARLLAAVANRGFMRHYSGIRIAKSGRRFRINDVTVWNLVDEQGVYGGQAAVYSQWEYL